MINKSAIKMLVNKAHQFPALSHIYALQMDRLMMTSGEPSLTFASGEWSQDCLADLERAGLSDAMEIKESSQKEENAIFTAESLGKKGKRTEAITYAFDHATGPQVNALNLFYANHISKGPISRLHYLNKYLSVYGLKVSLNGKTNTDFFQSLNIVHNHSKVEGPLVTIIMPAHNAEATIELAVNSLLNQSWHNLQIIIVDDASTDGTFKKAKALSKKDKRVQVLNSPVNVGPYVCRNLGLMQTQGQWVTVHDADDIAFADRIEQQVKALENTKYAACAGGMLRMNAHGQITRPSKLGPISADGYLRRCFASLFIETEVFRNKLAAWDSVCIADDSELFDRFTALGINVIHINRPLMLCLDEPMGLSNTSILGLLDESEARVVNREVSSVNDGLAFANHSESSNQIQADIKESGELIVSKLPTQVSKSLFLNTPDPNAFAAATLQEYKEKIDLPKGLKLPRVSVVMTSYNAAETIEIAVNSILFQSWPNLEVVVCDDRSTDATWTILCDLRDRHPHSLKVVRLERNSGTYLAKNVAVATSSGEYILFQDADDYSHPDRVKVQVLPLLDQPELIATRTKYCRFNPNSRRITPVAGLLSKYGLITLAVRRSAFQEIGFFDAVRKAGDDEWFQRLMHLYGKQLILNQDVTLYLAMLREDSLVSDMLKFNSDGSVEQNISAERNKYLQIFRSRFEDKKKRRSWYRSEFPVFPKRPLDIYPTSIASLTESKAPIIATLCSIPSRQKQLENVVARIVPQVDHLYVYLDKYPEIPSFLLGNTSITVIRSEDHSYDFRDNAKFLPYNEVKRKYGSFFYVTCDDDLEYPLDYVTTLIDRIESFDRSAIVGLHGVIVEEIPTGYFRRRFIHHFVSALLPHSKLVNNLGTGTVAFHSDVFESIDPRMWPISGMVDIFLSIEARKRFVPMICIDRSRRWLREQAMPEGNPTLFNEFNKKDEIIREQLSMHEPWGYKGILEAVAAQPEELKEKLSRLLPFFPEQLHLGETISRLR